MASIRERNGKYNVIYSYTDADGKRKQKWETYATKAEAKKRKKEIERNWHRPGNEEGMAICSILL